MDGNLTEQSWTDIPPIGDFVDLRTGQPAEMKTRVQIATARRWLYIAAACETENARRLKVSRQKRDSDVFNDESFEVLLDPLENHGRVYRFVINAGGTRMDEVIPTDGRGTGDQRPAWLGRARRVAAPRRAHWVAEIGIDLASLGLSAKNAGTWRANLIRHARGVSTSDSAWSLPRFWQFGCDRERMGSLAGIEVRGLSTGCGLRILGNELLPERNTLRGRAGVEVTNDADSRRTFDLNLRTPTRLLDKRQAILEAKSRTTVEFRYDMHIEEEQEIRVEVLDHDTQMAAAAIGYVLTTPQPILVGLDRSYYTDETSATLWGKLVGGSNNKQFSVKMFHSVTTELVWKNDQRIQLTNVAGGLRWFTLSLPAAKLPVGGYLVQTVMDDLGQRYRLWSALRRLNPRKGEVKVDANGHLLRDGGLFYPVEIRRVARPDAAFFDEIKSKAAFNMNGGWDLVTTATTGNVGKMYEGSGLLGNVNVDHLYYPLRASHDAPIARVKQLSESPAMFAYGMETLPDEETTATEAATSVRNYLQSLDPYHPFYVVLGHPSRAERCRDCADFLVMRCRAMGAGGAGEPEWVYEQVRQARQSVGLTIPVVAMLSAYRDPEQGLERPTPPQMRAMTYMALVAGAVGVIFDGYDYGGANDPEKKGFAENSNLRETIYVLSRHVALLGPIVLAPEARDAVTVEQPPYGSVRWTTRRYAGGVRLIAVNGAARTAYAAFRLPPSEGSSGGAAQPAPAVEVLDLLENRRVAVENQRFTAEFEPYGTHVFAINTKGEELKRER